MGRKKVASASGVLTTEKRERRRGKMPETLIPLSMLEKIYRRVYYDIADLTQIVYPSSERQAGARTSLQVLLGTIYGEMEKEKLIDHEGYMASLTRIYNRKEKCQNQNTKRK